LHIGERWTEKYEYFYFALFQSSICQDGQDAGTLSVSLNTYDNGEQSQSCETCVFLYLQRFDFQ